MDQKYALFSLFFVPSVFLSSLSLSHTISSSVLCRVVYVILKAVC